jgi:cytosine/adenosine deaminase-related metal-dependent hydrolase
MPPPRIAPRTFYEILQFVWWHLDKRLDRAMIRASALVSALACARNGVTFVIDHHASPFSVDGALETIATAFDEVGVGHLLCYELSDRDGPESRAAGLRETEWFLQNRTGLVGLHASFTVGDDLLRHAVDLASSYDSGLHIHVAEDPVDQEITLREHGCRVLPRLHQAGVLDFSKTILAHCIHLDDVEREILAASDAYVVQNVESNINNEVGSFIGRQLPPERIMLGTDGMHSDMIRSVQWTYFHGKAVDSLDLAGAYRRLRNVHRYLQTNGFAGDGANNLVLLDYDTPTPVHQDNWLGHFFYGLNAWHVHHVIAGGRWLVKDRQVLTVDAEAILASAREQARRLWEKLAV